MDRALIQQTRLKAGTLQILTKMKADPTRCSQAKETYLQQLQALKKSVTYTKKSVKLNTVCTNFYE